MKCATHPSVETALRCSRCEKPICPRCMVETPVGARCPECARLFTLPVYQVPPSFMARAIGTASGMAILTGFGWGLLASAVPFIYVNLLMGAAAGYAIGGVTSLAVNRKRATRLAVTAGLAAAASFVLSFLVPWGSPLNPSVSFAFIIKMAAAAVAVYLAVIRLKA